MGNPSWRKRTSIHDVARAAGVSTTTVSHSINGKGRVDEETRARVLRVARELRYRPNQNAINLLRNRSGILALTVGAPAENPVALGDLEYFVRFVNAATSTALGNGYALVLVPPTRAEALAGIEVDGAIVIDPVRDDPMTAELDQRSIPVVTSGRDPSREDDAWVDNDLPGCTELLLDHLRERGAERIALVAPPPIYSYSVDFREGYSSWCERSGAEPMVAEAANQLTETAGFEAARSLLEVPERPDGILAGLDRHALGVLLAAGALDLDVPGDLLLASATESEQTRTAEPPITALALHPERSGERAVEMLLARIEDPGAPAEPAILPAEIVVRESTEG